MQYTCWLKILSKTWSSASQQILILQKLASGIDPSLAYEAGAVSGQDGDTLPPSPSGMGSLAVSALRPDSKVTWSDGEAHSAPLTALQGSSRLNVEPPPSAPARDDFGLTQMQSVDAFWHDMPLGENMQRWDQFTQAYFKAPPSADPMHQAQSGTQAGGNGMVPTAPYPMAASLGSSMNRAPFLR